MFEYPMFCYDAHLRPRQYHILKRLTADMVFLEVNIINHDGQYWIVSIRLSEDATLENIHHYISVLLNEALKEFK